MRNPALTSQGHSVATSEVPVTHPGNLVPVCVCVCARARGLREFACACEHMHMFTKVAKLPPLTKAEVQAQSHLWFGMGAKERLQDYSGGQEAVCMYTCVYAICVCGSHVCTPAGRT